MKKLFLLLTVTIVLGACSGARHIVSQTLEPTREWTEQGLTTSYVFAKGIASLNPSVSGSEKRMNAARDAAILNARENMLTLIESSYMGEGLKVSQLVDNDAFLEEQISAVIEQNSRVVRTEWTESCHVIIRMPREALRSVGITLVK